MSLIAECQKTWKYFIPSTVGGGGLSRRLRISNVIVTSSFKSELTSSLDSTAYEQNINHSHQLFLWTIESAV